MSDTNVVKKDSEFNEENDKKKSFKFKMPKALTIIISILFFLVVISWIVSWTGATYDVTGEFAIKPGTVSFIDYGITTNEWDQIVKNIGGEEELLKAGITWDSTGITSESKALVIFEWDDRAPVSALGIFGVGIAMSNGFIAGADLIFYLFILGAVIELMLVSGAMETGISGLVKGFGGKEIFLIPFLVFLFSAGGAIYGMSEETIALFVIVVPALSLAGFDTVTGLLVILAGTSTGNAMSIVNPFNIGAATGAINGVAEGSSLEFEQGSIISFTMVWWLILTTITSSAITAYAAYVKKSPEKSVNFSEQETVDAWLKGFEREDDAPKATARQKGALTVFGLAFLLMILLFVPWTSFFKDFDYSTGTKDPIFGGIATLGTWYFSELSMLFIVAGTLIALILGMGMDKSTKAMWVGAKDMFSVGIMIAVARGIPFILESTGLQYWLVGGLIGRLKGVSPLVFLYISFFIFLLLSVVITSTSGLAGATMGLFTATIIGLTDAAGTGSAWDIDPMQYMGAIVVIYMLSIGIMNFFVPTSPIVMASMQQSRVTYENGVKALGSVSGIVFTTTLVAIIPTLQLLY